MSIPRIAKAMNNIDDDLISGAIEYENKRSKKSNWLKWGAMAACLCLIVVGAFVAPGLIGEQNMEQPLGQGFFNATVIAIEDETVTVECTESLQGEISVGSKVQISTNTVSSEAVPKLEVGDNVRVLYIGKTTEGNTVVLKDTISIFLLDDKGEPIVQPVDGECLELPDIEPTE